MVAEGRFYTEMKCTRLFGPEFLAAVQKSAADALGSGLPLYAFAAAFHASHEAAERILQERLAGEPDRLLRLLKAMHRAAMYELELLHVSAAELTRAEAGRAGEALRDEVEDRLGIAYVASQAVRSQAAMAGRSAGSVLTLATEVATASEQSATAMGEAATTAAGLIRAIDDARDGLGRAVAVAARAAEDGERADRTVARSARHAEEITSILGIVDKGQPQLD